MTGLSEAYVIGVDAGGTSVRALVADATGAVLGTGRAGGANPNSHPSEVAAGHIAEAIASAMAELSPQKIRACVVGMAGVSKLSDPAVAAVFDAAWRRVGLEGVVRVVTDAEAAFASATTVPDGTVLVAGTGSISGRIRQWRLVSTAGGYGWLLGDEGSAYWIGREAVRTTLQTLGSGRRLTGLAAAVLAEALGIAEIDELSETERFATWRELITHANAEPPIRLARFAPLVSAADQAGEAAARDITAKAAEFLVASAMAAREPGETTPVVLVGSVLGGNSPVGTRVRAGLAGLEVMTSSDGVLGATWLAAMEAFGEGATRPHPS